MAIFLAPTQNVTTTLFKYIHFFLKKGAKKIMFLHPDSKKNKNSYVTVHITSSHANDCPANGAAAGRLDKSVI